jgi:hypothetical protein
MNNFEIYVKTSALGKTGIHWRKIESQEHQPIAKPSLIQYQVIKGENNQVAIVNDLIDEVKPSLLIFRDQERNQLLLEVTGIESPQRSEKLGRKVLNAIVWIADDSEENEKILRKIGYSAIQNILGQDLAFSRMIEESINFFELEEFRVDLDRIQQFIEKLEFIDYPKLDSVEVENKSKIEFKSTDNLDNLATEILNNPFPKHWTSWDEDTKTDGVLVVVTENLEKRNILHKAGVWRGFASNLEKPQIGQKKTPILPYTESPILPAIKKPPIISPRKPRVQILILLLLTTTITILIFISIQYLIQPQQISPLQIQEQKILQPQVKPTSTPTQTPQKKPLKQKTLKNQEKKTTKP